MKNCEQGKSELASNRTARLFFAVWPELPLRETLHRWAVQQQKICGGRIMRVESIHLTLLFLGETPQAHLPELMHTVTSVRTARFDLALDLIAGWRHNGIAYAAPAFVPERLPALVMKLRACLAAAGFVFDQRPFTPHVTLLRKVDKTPEARSIEPPIYWSIDEFVLVQSVPEESGIRYEIVRRWSLE